MDKILGPLLPSYSWATIRFKFEKTFIISKKRKVVNFRVGRCSKFLNVFLNSHNLDLNVSKFKTCIPRGMIIFSTKDIAPYNFFFSLVYYALWNSPG